MASAPVPRLSRYFEVYRDIYPEWPPYFGLGDGIVFRLGEIVKLCPAVARLFYNYSSSSI